MTEQVERVTVFIAMNYSPNMTATEWQPFRGPFQRWPRVADALLAVVSFGLTIAIWYSDHPDDEPSLPFLAFLVFLLGNGCLYWRRAYPEFVHGVVLGASALAMLGGYMYGPIFALSISLYNIGRYSDHAEKSAAGLATAYLLLLIGELVFGGLSTSDFPEFFLPFVFWYTGRRLQARGEYLRVLQERALQLEREQQVEAERAVAAERTRIARELHDIVAHQVSVMTVQAGAAKTIVAADPVAAEQSMAAIEDAGRQALDELRHLLDVLRPAQDETGLGPQPGRSDLPRLVAELRNTGLDVKLSISDTGQQLPARTELAIYRIVQEALTNVLKHGGSAASADVRLRITEQIAIIEIEDNGNGESRLPGSGHGITGMRERAQSLNGTLEAGPRAGRGFSVVARLPLGDDAR